MQAGRHPLQRGGVVDPQARPFAAAGQLDAQAPAHADVAVVVDDLAEDVPEHGEAAESCRIVHNMPVCPRFIPISCLPRWPLCRSCRVCTAISTRTAACSTSARRAT